LRRKPKQAPNELHSQFLPLQGGYFWLPSSRNGQVAWDVLTCHEIGFDAEVGHLDLWPTVIGRLAKIWNKDARVLRRLLKNHCYGLPRGRVTQPGNHSLILHGNDAPLLRWQDMVVRRFVLDQRAVKFVYDEHETMLTGDRKKVIEILGIALPELEQESDVD
jgi:hypothetical protein